MKHRFEDSPDDETWASGERAVSWENASGFDNSRSAAVADFARAAPARSVQSAAELRALLAEKFPAAPARKTGRTLPTGLPLFDEQHGGLRTGSVTELSGSTGHGSLFITAMLEAAVREQCFVALVDGGRTFDPQSHDPQALARLLWVQCETVKHAIKAADLLLRDGNLPLLLLDLQALPLRELGSIPASTWHRFQRLAEQTTIAFVVLTPRPMAEAARIRLTSQNRWPLDTLHRRRGELLQAFALQMHERGAGQSEQSTPARRLA